MRYVILLALLATTLVAAEPTRREIKGTELIVQAALDELEAPDADIGHQPSEKLAEAFPGYLFVLAEFGEIAPEDLPQPLLPRSLFAVPPDGTPVLLTTPEDVLELFKTAFKPIKTADDARQAAEAALALEEAKFPGQQFAPPSDLKATPDGQGGFQASGSSQPPSGASSGSGLINVELSIPATGRPAGLKVVNKFRPALRRRQVTPADIAADQPRAQQLAGGPVTNINSPTINKILPGGTFFVPKSDAGKEHGRLVAVGPDGKPRTFDSLFELARFVRQQFAPVKTKQQAKDAMQAYLTLVPSLFPSYRWAAVQDSDIHVSQTAKGGLEVDGKVFVEDNSDQWVMADWTFGKRGHTISSRRAVNGVTIGP